MTVHFGAAPDKRALRLLAAAAAGADAGKALRFAKIATKDWVGESLAGLAPVTAGRFVVHGAHDRVRVPVNRTGLEIEAALAFGTGHHGTTRGCLLALDRLSRVLGAPRRVKIYPSPWKGEGQGGGHSSSDRSHTTPTRLALARRPPPFRGRNSALRILDLGTGTGVLAIAAARTLRRRVLAVDVDRNAVDVAQANARLNRVGPLIRIVQANGVTPHVVRAGAPYDLILANILLKPLQRFAAPLSRLVAPGGRVVLSGILDGQANAVRAAYHRLTLERRMSLEGWTTLILRRGSRRRPVIARIRWRS